MRRSVPLLSLLAALAVPVTASAQLPADARMTTVAANGTAGVAITNPQWVTPTPDGARILVADFGSNNIEQVNADGTGGFAVWAGSGAKGPSPTDANGDGGLATAATFDLPVGATFRKDGSALVVDANHHKIRLVAADGKVSTIVGSGQKGVAGQANGDGGPAKDAALQYPGDVAVLADGLSFLVADAGNRVIRRYDHATGTITTVAGTGALGDTGHQTDPKLATFKFPQSVALEADGKSFLVTDRMGATVWRVRLDGGEPAVARVAGTPSTRTTFPDPPWTSGASGSYSSTGVALTSGFNPITTTPLADGSFLVMDLWNDRIRRVGTDGSERTVVGNGTAATSPDGAPTQPISKAHTSYVEPDGDLVFIESGGLKVRRVTGAKLAYMAPAWDRLAVLPPAQPPVVTDPPAAPQPNTEQPTTDQPKTDAPGTDAKPEADPKPDEQPQPKAEQPVDASDRAPVAGPPAPVPGRSVVVAPATGAVLVRGVGERGFHTLAAGESVPYGATVDTRGGSVALTTAAPAGGVQTARFSGGVFTVKPAAGGITEAVLSGGSFARCPRAARGGATVRAAAGRKPVRRLWGSGKGRFRTRGRHAAATVRGTTWLVEDRCDGTLTRVREGVVAVRDLRTGRTALVRAGRERFVRAPR